MDLNPHTPAWRISKDPAILRLVRDFGPPQPAGTTIGMFAQSRIGDELLFDDSKAARKFTVRLPPRGKHIMYDEPVLKVEAVKEEPIGKASDHTAVEDKPNSKTSDEGEKQQQPNASGKTASKKDEDAQTTRTAAKVPKTIDSRYSTWQPSNPKDTKHTSPDDKAPSNKVPESSTLPGTQLSPSFPNTKPQHSKNGKPYPVMAAVAAAVKAKGFKIPIPPAAVKLKDHRRQAYSNNRKSNKYDTWQQLQKLDGSSGADDGYEHEYEWQQQQQQQQQQQEQHRRHEESTDADAEASRRWGELKRYFPA